MGRPTAATAHFPYPTHRTVEEVWRSKRDMAQTIVDLDNLSRRRTLTPEESRSLEILIRKQSRVAA